ncbi:MAG: elongation factor P [bacterium]
MLNINDLKVGTTISFRGHAAVVMYTEHSKVARGGGIMRTKIRDLETGTILEHVFKGNDKIEELNINRKKAQFLYKDTDQYYFMDPESYEQFSLNSEVLDDSGQYLQDNKTFTIIYADDKALNVELPIKMDFKVAEADPAVKGNTVSGGTKNAILENNIKVQVPLFVKAGDMIRIDTRNGKYVERV